MNLANQFDSRRKGRMWITRQWPNHFFVKFKGPAAPSGVEWACDRHDVYHDSTARRWWFKDPKLAMEFKLRFVGKI